jgi:4-amino-4-deoxy-L-arabinose transferase-like glycosyltransferase
MKRQILAWRSSRRGLLNQDRAWEGLWVLGLLGSAIALYTLDLGRLPLRDWDEGTVAQVAREIYNAPLGSLRWLFPTLWGEPYLNQPPLMHNLIALAYHLGGINEWTARLPSAILTACSVPLLYGVGREVFRLRKPAFYSALIYLTWLPVVRHGRLAMLDGAVVCFGGMLFWCVLRSRRDLRWGLGIGISLGLIGLTKGMMAILLGAIAIVFLAWDTPRLLRSFYLWIGVVLGSFPVLAWYTAQGIPLGKAFVNTAIVQQSLARIWVGVENPIAPPWYYLLELLKYGFPWLLFVGYGLKLAKDNINWSWAKLVLIWGGGYFLVVSLMMTKLPWSILPVYPALALAGGAKLAEVESFPSSRSHPQSWTITLVLMTVATTFASFYFAITDPNDFTMVVILGAVTLTMGVTAMLIEQRDIQFILVLAWGSYVSLLLLMSSPHWNWELNEAYRVKPVANLIQQGNLPAQATIYTTFAYERPALNFYSNRRILPLPLSSDAYEAKLNHYWQTNTHPYLLLDRGTFSQLSLSSLQVLGRVNDWILVTKFQD